VSHRHDRHIDVEALTRVEGEGAMHVRVVDGHVEGVQLSIYEPPRYFEALLRGRSHLEPPDITARICGICPVAYQLSACNAIEDAAGVPPLPEPIRQLRRLLYCGEWIESHVLHVFMLHAPDFLGYPSVIEMAADHRDLVETALRLRRVGNRILDVVGGRAIHPVNVRVGGFHRAPTPGELDGLRGELEWAVDAAADATRLVAGLDFPELVQDHAFVALRPEAESWPAGATGYPLEQGRVVSSDGLDLPVSAWDDHFTEEQVAHSTALHGRRRGGGTYLVGPQARHALNSDRLVGTAAAVAREVGFEAPVRNPFRSIVVRLIETVYALEESLRLIAAYRRPDVPAVDVPPVAATGYGATEAPRGLLYHRYVVAGDGSIADAVISPPTAQNQPAVEHDLAAFVEAHLHLDDGELRRRCEQAIRNYDPCISCSTHFLDLTVERT
jgi:sulfhydrogenase subunit alpha